MAQSTWRAADAGLRRLSNIKHRNRQNATPLGSEMLSFFQESIQKRQTKFSKLAETWAKLVPETLGDHCTLDSMSRGTLTVLVDSASHLYELKQLLLAGLQQQLVIACKSSGLKKISLKPGRPNEVQESGQLSARLDRLQKTRDLA
jgi:hypothetical protein